MATPFDLDIRFTGICAFVPNVDPLGDYSLCVVMPGDDRRRNAIDGDLLCPHSASVRFYPAEPSPQPSPPPPFPPQLYEVPLKKCRVALDVSPASGRPVLPDNPPAFLLDLPVLIGSHAVIHPAIVGDHPPSPPVMVQVLLGAGTVSYVPDLSAKWDIDPLDHGQGQTQVTLVHEVQLTLPSLTHARLTGSTFGGAPVDIDLDPRKVPGAAFVRIVNICDKTRLDHNDDPDFKWYYELLIDNKKDAIARELSGKKLPIPHHIPLIGGQDCFPGRLPAVIFP